MDPPVMIYDGAFQAARVAPYNMAEIWPFPASGCEAGAGLELRKVQFGQRSRDQSVESLCVNREVSAGDPMVLGQGGAQRGGSRKRRDSVSEDESAKVVSTSAASGMVLHALNLECTHMHIMYLGISCLLFCIVSFVAIDYLLAVFFFIFVLVP